MPPSTPQGVNQESSHQELRKSRRFDPLATLSRKRFRETTHLNLSYEPVAFQFSSADPAFRSNSQAIEQSIGTTRPDAHHFSTGWSTRIVSTGRPVHSWSTEHSHSDRFATRIAMFENAHNFSIENASIMNIGHQQVNNNHQHVYHHDPDSLNEFVSFSALHDSSAQDPERCCHPGTREKVLHKMCTWMDDPNAPERILWLHGPAGVGKSAIAQTISNSYDRDKIGATFFFFRSDPIRNDGNRLFPTLAWQLAFSVAIVKDLIASSLEEYPDLPTKAIEIQFNKLIVQPFLTISDGEILALTYMRVIIIDGLDECSDTTLQERILKIIGNAVADTRFPLRFIISCRPEAHIKDFFSQFEHPTLRIDLAEVDDAFRDIETYLTWEFARIANEQKLDPKTWPAQAIINTLVFKSSGQFVYATTVMKYVGDKYESAVAQLNVILGLRPINGKSLFPELDALYTEILQRQPDQSFLKEFLLMLVARSLLSGTIIKDGKLHEDDAMLLGLEETQLHRKLRGMCSILKFEPFIDVYHKSFLDFLDDSSRSGEYHVSKDFASRRYMELITDILVKAASKAMEPLNFHGSDHFQPRFATLIQNFPLKIELQLNDLEEILQPLLIIQNKLLQLPNMSVPWKPKACEECWTFYIIDDLLLHLACFRGTTQLQEPKHVGIRPLTPMEEKQNIPQLDLDTCLSLLLADLRSVESHLSLNVNTVGLMRALIRFDPTETAMKLRSITDAQNLIELIFCLNRKECFKSWFGTAAHNATRLALAIYGRVPLLPRSLFLNLDRNQLTYRGKAVKIWDDRSSVWRDCFDSFMWGSLSHTSIIPCLGICFQSVILKVSLLPENTMLTWRRSGNPSVSQIQQTFFEIAKAIQYIHSLDFTLSYRFAEYYVYVDPGDHVKVQVPGLRPNDLCKGRYDYDGIGKVSTLEHDIHQLGRLFYRVLLNNKYDKITFKTRPIEPEVPDNLWQLIQWCCADDPKERPVIDQVVQEMESWISLGQFTSLS